MPGTAESRLLGASEAWSQEREQGLARGLMPVPHAGRKPCPSKLWAKGSRKCLHLTLGGTGMWWGNVLGATF